MGSGHSLTTDINRQVKFELDWGRKGKKTKCFNLSAIGCKQGKENFHKNMNFTQCNYFLEPGLVKEIRNLCTK